MTNKLQVTFISVLETTHAICNKHFCDRSPDWSPLSNTFRFTILGADMGNTKQTSAKVASQASKILSNPKSTAAQKSVAASDLAQTKSNSSSSGKKSK